MNYIRTLVFLLVIGAFVSLFGTGWLAAAVKGIMVFFMYLFSNLVSPLMPCIIILVGIVLAIKTVLK